MPSMGPILPPAQAGKRKREIDDEDNEADLLSSRTPDVRPASGLSSARKVRPIGPSLPPASIDERPPQPLDGDATGSSGDDDDDDDFGPSLPTSASPPSRVSRDAHVTVSATGTEASASTKSQRDEWMIVPPTSGDWSSRMDPTKLKTRKFNAGKGAKGPAQASGKDSNANWTETLEEKRARLQREMLGLKDTSTSVASPIDDGKARENVKRLREYSEKSRGPTLYKEHQKTNPQEKEDDPSARAFDRDKDIAGGMKINHTQRREMMNKAADFGSRFSSGKFL